MQLDKMINNWPPAYSLRHSKKAKRILLRVSDAKGLELVVPESMKPPQIPDLLERHRLWITRQLERRALRLAEQSRLHGESPFRTNGFAPGFYLHGEALRVQLDIGKGLGGAALQELFASSPSTGTVVWPLPASSENELLRRLVICVKAYAKIYLRARLVAVANSSGLSFSRLNFGMPKSRWGSYARGGSIRLNYKLIFLPAALADYIILHELCHSTHLNHSQKFWALVQSKDSGALLKDAALREASKWIPLWFA